MFQLEEQATDALGQTRQEVRYGITSLPNSFASPERLMALVRPLENREWTALSPRSQHAGG